MPKPVSIMAHREHQQARAQSRFNENLRQAGLRATHDDDAILNAIAEAVAQGDASYEDGNDLVLRVRRDQAQRHQAAA